MLVCQWRGGTKLASLIPVDRGGFLCASSSASSRSDELNSGSARLHLEGNKRGLSTLLAFKYGPGYIPSFILPPHLLSYIITFSSLIFSHSYSISFHLSFSHFFTSSSLPLFIIFSLSHNISPPTPPTPPTTTTIIYLNYLHQTPIIYLLYNTTLLP